MSKKHQAAADQIHIRWMIRADSDEVLKIDEQNFGSQAIDEAGLIEYLRQWNCIGMVATIGQVVVGYMIYELHKSRLYLIRLAVDSSVHRRGYGRALIEHIQKKLSRDNAGRHLLVVDVPEINLGAQLFFKALGLRAIYVLRDHFDDGQAAYRFAFDRAGRPADQLEALVER